MLRPDPEVEVASTDTSEDCQEMHNFIVNFPILLEINLIETNSSHFLKINDYVINASIVIGVY